MIPLSSELPIIWDSRKWNHCPSLLALRQHQIDLAHSLQVQAAVAQTKAEVLEVAAWNNVHHHQKQGEGPVPVECVGGKCSTRATWPSQDVASRRSTTSEQRIPPSFFGTDAMLSCVQRPSSTGAGKKSETNLEALLDRTHHSSTQQHPKSAALQIINSRSYFHMRGNMSDNKMMSPASTLSPSAQYWCDASVYPLYSEPSAIYVNPRSGLFSAGPSVPSSTSNLSMQLPRLQFSTDPISRQDQLSYHARTGRNDLDTIDTNLPSSSDSLAGQHELLSHAIIECNNMITGDHQRPPLNARSVTILRDPMDHLASKPQGAAVSVKPCRFASKKPVSKERGHSKETSKVLYISQKDAPMDTQVVSSKDSVRRNRLDRPPVIDIETRWEKMYLKLIAFKKAHGHTRVPDCHEDAKLINWVANQRKAMSRHKRGLSFGRFDRVRIDRLEKIGFEWGQSRLLKQGSYERYAWEDMFKKLVEFQENHGHTRVSANIDRRLANWVRNQRTAMSRMQRGLPFRCLNKRRIEKLEFVGFQWSVPSSEG